MKKMKKMPLLFAALLFVALSVVTNTKAEPVVKVHYVFLNYSGEYTGQADSNGIPFGFGVFVSETTIDGEAWHYIGQWEDGLPSGDGGIYFENGNMQKGTFTLGVLTNGLAYTVTGLAANPVSVERVNEETEAEYIGNKKSLRFHKPSCRAVQQMKESNKVEFFSREEAIERHYIPCGECNP